MRILVDASGLEAAGPEERDFFRDVVRHLLRAGKQHSFGIVGWPRKLGVGPAELLSPLPHDAASWCMDSPPTDAPTARPTVWYSPLGEVATRDHGAARPSVPRIESCFESGERSTRPKSEDDVWTITVSRSTFTVLVEHEGHSIRRVRQLRPPALPHGIWDGEPADREGSVRDERARCRYVLTTLTGSSPTRFAALVSGVLRHRAQSRDDIRLLVLGQPPAGLRPGAWWAKVRGHVRFLGELPRRRRAALLAGAEAFVLSGGGDASWITSREALAVGTPVLAPLESPVPEILGDAALYYAPSDPADLAAALARYRRCEALRRLLAQRGIHRAEANSMDRFVVGVLDVVAEIERAAIESGRLPGGPRKVLA